MHCAACGAAVGADAQHCPECGATVAAETNDEMAGDGGGGSDTPGQQVAGGPAGQQTANDSPQQGGARGAQHRQGTGEGLVSELPIVGGAIFGGLAFAFGLILITALTVLATLLSDSTNLRMAWILLLQNTLGSPPESIGDIVAMVGWVFYSAHNVGISSGIESINLIADFHGDILNPPIPAVIFYLVPVGVLSFFSLVLTERASYDGVPTAMDGAKAGATIAVGYLVPALVGALTVFSISRAGLTAGPELVTTLILMGGLYPVGIGGLTGYLAKN